MIKNIVLSQYQNIVNQATKKSLGLSTPPEGWICTVRKSLGMSGAQLARRLGVTRAMVSQTEKAETSGNLTLKTIQDMAEAMECRFVYAIIPAEEVETIISNQARKKAKRIVYRTSDHMALEAQALSNTQIEYEIDRLAKEMINRMPADFWDEKS